jgi:hypothetical protein
MICDLVRTAGDTALLTDLNTMAHRANRTTRN